MFQLNSPALWRKVDIVLVALAVLFGAAWIAAGAACDQRALTYSDQFDPDLQSVRDVDSAVAYVKGTRRAPGALASAEAADAFVRKRFVHGYSELAPCENWVAYLAGFIRPDLRNPVLPNDILQHRRAACSQQAIVFQAIARELGLDVGSVRLVGHFLPAARVDGQWRVFDPDREIDPASYSLSAFLRGDPRIEQAYGRFGQELGMVRQAESGKIHLGDINSNPAPRASLFQSATRFLSEFGWAVFLGLFIARHAIRALRHDRRRRSRPRAATRGAQIVG